MVHLKKILVFWGIASLVLVIPGGVLLEAAAINGTFAESDFVRGEVLILTRETNLSDEELISNIKFSSPVPIQSVEKLHNSDFQKRSEPYGKRFLTLKFDKEINPLLVADAVRKSNFVLIAEPNFLGFAAMMPNDPTFPVQWGLHNIGQWGGTPDADIDAPEAWDIESGTSSVVVALIDTGVDLDHEDLVAKILPSWDAVHDDFIPEDDHGHGTWVTGVAGASTNNSRGVAGTCPDCMLLPVKGGVNYNGQPAFSVSAVYKALEFAVNNPGGVAGVPPNPYVADVISMSFVFTSDSSLLHQGITDAYNAGAILVAGAGNNNNSSFKYPAAYDEVIAVAATDRNDNKASFSNYGNWVDVAAPGVEIYTTGLNDSYTGPSGTSLSTPFVAGVAALMLSRPNAVLTASQIREALIDTSDPVTGFPVIVGGRINAEQALSVNITPFMYPLEDKLITERQLLVIDVNAGDGNGDPLTYSTDASGVLPSSFSFNQQTGLFSWRPTYNDAGQYVVTFSVTDGRGGSDFQAVTITVLNKPTPPKMLPMDLFMDFP